MRREMKHPMVGFTQSDSQNQNAGIISAARAVLARMATGFNSINAIRVDDCTQMAAPAGISCYSIRQQGSRPH